MKTPNILYLIIIAIFAIDCSSNKQLIDNLPSIDVRKSYPEKEIFLTDIANVTYVHLCAEDGDYLYHGGIKSITENTFVVMDVYSGSVLFFSRDGKPKSRFNRYGRGPKEYPVSNTSIFYDETVDDVFMTYSGFQVYSSTGEYKRTISLPYGVGSVVHFDEQSFLVYCDPLQFRWQEKRTDSIPRSDDHPIYYRISKTDGEVLDSTRLLSKNVDLTKRGGQIVQSKFKQMTHFADEFLLCPPAADTVFLYRKDKSITPIFCKTPLVSKFLDDYPKIVLADFLDAGRYQFMTIETLYNWDDMAKLMPFSQFEATAFKYYMRDKKTGNIFRPKICLMDYRGKELFISARNTEFNGKETLARIELDLLELKQAYAENKLSGKLKELVATLKDDGNNVFVIAELK